MCYSMCAKTSYEKNQDSLEEMSKAAQPAGGPVQERFRLAWGLPAVGLLLWGCLGRSALGCLFRPKLGVLYM